MKKVLFGLGAVMVVIIAIVVAVFFFAGDVIKTAVEKIGSEATQAKVTLHTVDLDMIQGSGAMKGLVVGNPKGFKTPSAFELGSISLQIDKSTLSSNPVVIDSIAINGPIVTYEKANGTSNVDAIKANVDAFAKKFSGGGTATTSDSKQGGGKKLLIKKLTITGGQVKLNAGVLGDKTLNASLPDLTLTDIGKDSGGASPAEVAKSVIDKLTAGIMSINPDKLIGNAAQAIQGAAKAATDAAKGVSEGAGKAVEGVTSGAGSAVEGVGDKVKSLFGK